MISTLQEKAKNLLENYGGLPSRKEIDNWIDEIEKSLENEELPLLYSGYNLQTPGVVAISFRAFSSYTYDRALTVNFSDVLYDTFSIFKVRVCGIEDEKTVVFKVPYGKDGGALGLLTLLTDEWLNDKNVKLTLPIGMGSAPFYYEISKMPHLAVCGGTGTGKSVFTHSILISLAIKYTPDEVKFALCDPKMVEYTQYEGLPHLYSEVVTETPAFIELLEKLNGEVNNRFDAFSACDCFNIDDYNKKAKQLGNKPFAKIIFLCDELADFVYNDFRAEMLLKNLMKRCRAVGIYVVAISQERGLENDLLELFPCRIAFKMFSSNSCYNFIKSRTPLTLNSRGEMVFVDNTYGETVLQGSYVSVKEIDKILSLLKETY